MFDNFVLVCDTNYNTTGGETYYNKLLIKYCTVECLETL